MAARVGVSLLLLLLVGCRTHAQQDDGGESDHAGASVYSRAARTLCPGEVGGSDVADLPVARFAAAVAADADDADADIGHTRCGGGRWGQCVRHISASNRF